MERARAQPKSADTPAGERLGAERLRDLARLSGAWLWETNAGHRIVFCADPENARTRIARELVGLTCLDIFPADFDPAARDAHLEDLAARRPFRDFVVHAHLPSGLRRWIRIDGNPRHGRDGRFLGYRGVFVDHTEPMAMAERLRLAIGAMRDGFFLWDAEDRLVLANRPVFGLLGTGVPPDEAVGRGFEELLRVALDPGMIVGVDDPEAFIQAKLKQHRDPRGVVETTRTDGRTVQVREARTADGGIITVVTDISAQRDYERWLRQSKEEAEAANRAKTSFLASVTHELRTPLNAIIGFSELLATGIHGGLNTRQRGYLDDVLGAARDLLGTINHLLDAAKIEAGKVELYESVVNPFDTLAQAARLLAPQIEEAGLKLVIEPCRDPLGLLADDELLRRMLHNLLSNAVKFTPRGGHIVMRCERHDGGYAITVRDSGIGMRPEDVALLARPYHQIANALTRKHLGTGLGLSIVKGLIERHGGRLEIDSEPGAGTAVTLVFPADRVRRA